jgi:phosphate transport system protein
MARLDYQEQLRQLQATVLDELDLVGRQLSLVLEALERGDSRLADEVIAGDEEVDRLYRLLQANLVTVIARQAPVASDLRLITSLLHISRMVERMGDQCGNIAKLVSVAGPSPPGADDFRACLLSMGRATEDAVRSAGRALRAEDSAAADALEAGDAVVDELNRSCFSQAIDFGDSADRRAWATAMILVSRALERIADNAVDIGAHLRFAVTGSFEHSPVAPAT